MSGQPGPVSRLVAWYGPDPERVDTADVRLAGDRLSARGTSLVTGYALSYRLETGPAWVTRQLSVRVDDDTGWRELHLRRGDDGRWSTAHRRGIAGGAVGAEGPGAPPHFEEQERPDLDGALDADLGLCPLTNTMPVLREGLLAAAHASQPRRAELTMAWVAVPELVVTASPQAYEALSPVSGGGAVVAFSSEGFAAPIELDADGLVVHYPHIGRRLGLPR